MDYNTIIGPGRNYGPILQSTERPKLRYYVTDALPIIAKQLIFNRYEHRFLAELWRRTYDRERGLE